jgi:hypothetical protein
LGALANEFPTSCSSCNKKFIRRRASCIACIRVRGKPTG